MKLSRKSRYGVRAMVDLALHYKKGPIAVGDISKREGISTHYLEQILNALRRKNMVKSLRGPKGGYILAKGPGRISVRQIVEILEGDISPVLCAAGKRSKACERMDICVTKLVWDKLNDCIKATLGSVTLADLLKEAEKLGIDKRLKHEYTFHI